MSIQPHHTDRLLLLAQQKGLLRPNDLTELGIPRVYLTRLTASGKLARAGRGLYRLADASLSENEGLTIVAARAPQAVFCLLTALQFHGLTTQLPRQVWIALPQGSHAPKMDYPPVKLIQYSGDAFTQGIETHRIDQVDIRAHPVAKALVNGWKLQQPDVAPFSVEDFGVLNGRGVKGVIDGQLWHLGNHRLVEELGLCSPALEARLSLLENAKQ